MAIATLGAVLGAVGGFWLGHVVVHKAALRVLADYGAEMVKHADEYGSEVSEIRRSFNPSPYAFCSAEEIAQMQALTFRSLQVKDVGRIRDGLFYCSAFLGRLEKPWPTPKPTMTLSGTTKIYSQIPIKIAGARPGTIIESGGVNVVLSPTAFDHWSRPHIQYMVVIVNRKTHQMVPIAGATLSMSAEQILGQEKMREKSTLYQAQCSKAISVCVVTAESIADMGDGTEPLLFGYTGLGGLAGLGLGLAVALLYAQRKGLAQQLRRAIRNDSLMVVYQPVWDLPVRRFAGMEALVRWSDQDGVPVTTDYFVRIAEERGFVSEITALVVRRTAREMGELLRQNPELTLSINIAAEDMEGEHLFTLLEEHIRRKNIAPGQIALELTERSTTDLDVVRSAVLRLHENGYKVHIDDFGTGFSSLSYLHELSVDAIKIDRAFTRTVGTDAVTASILPQILSLAESQELDVIVEGVETEAQAEYLEATGRPMQAQGWFFSYPVAAAEIYSMVGQRETAAKV